MPKKTVRINNTRVSLYKGNPNLKGLHNKIPLTEEQFEEYVKCSQDPVYFIEKYVKIISLDEGWIPFTLRDYQHRVINGINDNRYTIIRQGRQSGKTVTVGSWLLWYILFNDMKKACILANKGQLARSHLSNIQKSYESLPLWMQQGVAVWNKGNIVLENGSELIAASTSATSIRGEAMNVVYLDEWAFVHPNMQEEFMTSTYPVITSGTESKIIVTSTPNGMEMYYKMWVEATEGRSAYFPIDVHWKEVPGRDEKWAEEYIKNTSERQFSQEIECEFLGSSNTLISGKKLRSMTFLNPIWTDDDEIFKVYDYPQKGHKYAITVDVSEGVGMDYSVLNITDITEVPYQQAAIFRSNNTSPQMLPELIFRYANSYNEAIVLIEIGGGTVGIGGEVANILYDDLEYENIVMVSSNGRKGQVMSGGFGGKSMYGLKMTKPVKALGCSTLKALIENDKYIVKDFATFNELTTFVHQKDSFAADENKHDDTTMTLVGFSWLINQPHFKEMADLRKETRKELFDENIARLEKELTPVGFGSGFNMQSEPEPVYIKEDGDLWEVVGSFDGSDGGF